MLSFGVLVSWAKTLQTLTLSDSTRAFGLYEQHWQMFNEGEPAQTENPVMRELIESVLVHASTSKEE